MFKGPPISIIPDHFMDLYFHKLLINQPPSQGDVKGLDQYKFEYKNAEEKKFPSGDSRNGPLEGDTGRVSLYFSPYPLQSVKFNHAKFISFKRFPLSPCFCSIFQLDRILYFL
jgi:hypothetical protein